MLTLYLHAFNVEKDMQGRVHRDRDLHWQQQMARWIRPLAGRQWHHGRQAKIGVGIRGVLPATPRVSFPSVGSIYVSVCPRSLCNTATARDRTDDFEFLL